MDSVNVRARHLLVGVLFIAVVIGAVVLVRFSGSDRRDRSPRDSRERQAGAEVDRRSSAHARSDDGPPRADGRAGRGKAAASAQEARARLERDIAVARERRVARAEKEAASEGGDSPGPRPELEVGSMEKEYIQERVREIVPLVKECYEMALERKPTLAGKLVVRFTLAGEPEIGGIVESSEIDAERSTITDPGMSECLSESMYALEFDPPSNGGRVEVAYPFKFRASDDEE